MLKRRPWGWFVVLFRAPFAWLKLIRVREGHRTSLQWHAQRKEYWISYCSSGSVRVGHQQFELFAPFLFAIQKGQWHRIYGPALLLEVAWGLPREDDIVRLDDDYGRA